MADQLITTASTLQCPHGGSVTIAGSNTRVKATAAVALVSDTFTVAGCPFQIPATPPIPSPCVKVVWVKPDVRTKVNSTATLSHASVGLCLAATGAPQGPVSKVTSQLKAKGT